MGSSMPVFVSKDLWHDPSHHRWVQEHISGDPEKVALWGESAGAGSVLQHIIANGGRTSPPLFRAAITSSTYLPPQYPYDHRIPEVRALNPRYSPIDDDSRLFSRK
ncbi:Carboxylic ester hydrolase [Mycena chlorophos]|uniref:Carboxylic ester hydrolase n=1 Tax=Mycena chlorophos TaxID=658473 RepID=A0A8H6WJJ0_MYCCL|nr:Carboxylic ester hydrolase [Mycena chlorophos]